MKNADIPAMPTTYANGLSKREYFSAVALQGILTKYGENNFSRRDSMVEIAVGYADALLKELDK